MCMVFWFFMYIWYKKLVFCKYWKSLNIYILGYCFMIGVEIGKVINYVVCLKFCCVCENVLKFNLKLGVYDCWKKFEGSVKSMELDMVVLMVKDMNEKGIKMGILVVDDDVVILCCLWVEFIDILKELDKNYVWKNFLLVFFFL